MKTGKPSSGQRGRDIFNNVLAKYQGQYGKNAGFIISQVYLRLQSAALSATQGSFFAALRFLTAMILKFII